MLDSWTRCVEEFTAVGHMGHKRLLKQQQMKALNRRISQVERDY